MLRRSILELSSRRPFRRLPTQITTQIPSHLSSRKEFSVASPKNAPQGSGPTGKPSESGSSLSKAVIGSVALGAAVLAAYQTGYLDRFLVNDQHSALDAKVGTANKDPQGLMENNRETKDDEPLEDKNPLPSFQATSTSSPSLDPVQKKNKSSSESSGFTRLDNLSKIEGEIDSQEKLASALAPGKDIPEVQESKLSSSDQSSRQSEDGSTNNGTQESLHTMSPGVEPNEQNEPIETTPTLTRANEVPEDNEMKSMPLQHQIPKSVPEDTLGTDTKQSNPLLDEYYLRDVKTEEPSAGSIHEHKDLEGAVKDSNGFYITKDGKLVLDDFLEAIHAAEKRQAELDAHKFGEEKRMMKEKYEKELRDARARELMYAEREAILDKELIKEKVKSAAALKSLQEKLEEEFKTELELMKAEAEQELKKTQELGKAELASAIAKEKASQIEKMMEANLDINALCMAFYARSEEARQSDSVHKLALGALAIEDALSKGLPIQKEINALHTYLEGIDKGSVLDLVLSSLPEETRSNGTDTVLQLNHKFDALKGTLRHFSLIPPGGGGILVHSLASVASLLKVKEYDQSGDGIESLINEVDSFLADGKLMEAADTLEDGLKGTQAAEVVADWVKQARNRAITEQALTLLQSYATAVSLT